jgi:hypothetical protein
LEDKKKDVKEVQGDSRGGRVLKMMIEAFMRVRLNEQVDSRIVDTSKDGPSSSFYHPGRSERPIRRDSRTDETE